MITHIRIQNLRSLVDTGFIEIKPLTILLGNNSSGKSTFLRSFPLFSQSVTKSLREPISWFDDSYVDFGDYDTAKSKLAPDSEGIIFSYKVQTPLNYKTKYFYSIKDDNCSFVILPNSTISLSFIKDSKGIFVNRLTLINDNLHVEFSIKERDSLVDMIINGESIMEEYKEEYKLKWYYGSNRSLIPEFNLLYKYDDKIRSINTIVDGYVDEVILKYCSKKLRNYERLWEIICDWTFDKKEFLGILQKSKMAILRKNASLWDVETKEFKEIYNSLALLYTIKSLDSIDEEIKSMYNSCSYIAPMRAAANRYYRTQGLQIRDVDPYGKNLQEFIASLSGKREKSYRSFTEKVLGLQVMVKNNAGHQQIILKSEYGENNMTDVGFGYSQILPVVTKLWHSNYQLKNEGQVGSYWKNFFSNIMLIEQPELHLHPAMQARTIDIIMLLLKEIDDDNKLLKEKQVKNSLLGREQMFSSLIIETHSQAMINRIGRRIREKQFSADKVSILMFEKNNEIGRTEVKEIKFNEKGQLMNWPQGFFEPKVDDYDILFNK